LEGPYLKEIPLDPCSMITFMNAGQAQPTSYDIMSTDRTGDLAAKMTLQLVKQEVAPPRGLHVDRVDPRDGLDVDCASICAPSLSGFSTGASSIRKRTDFCR